MSVAEAFFDTNVVLYLFSGDAAKADRVEDLLAEGGCVSVQVLNELTNVARRKLGFSWREVFDVSNQIRATCRVAALTVETHARGLEIARRYQFSVYDGMIVASALLSGCKDLYTEDLQHGQVIDKRLTLQNPFARR
jgi:predicted nucleic acid-binding protein